MSTEEYGQLSHLARRAGFGATRAELEEYASKGYEAVVEELLNPGDPQVIPDDILRSSSRRCTSSAPTLRRTGFTGC